MGLTTKHKERDLLLAVHREVLLENAMKDLTSDKDVLAIYLSGSLAKGSYDAYSDIDLHTIVKPEKKYHFIEEKRSRSAKWGNILYFEDSNPRSPVVVTHYDCFVKVDSWYHAPEEIVPSIWLKGLKVLYDPHNLISGVFEESSKMEYEPSKEEVEFWRGKVVAYIHETYRAAMRDELYYAMSNLDMVRWLVASGWYMEKNQHLDSAYGIWSKVEGKRSKLNKDQLALLACWECGRDPELILSTIVKMYPEIVRLNRKLSDKVGIEEQREHLERLIKMVI
ncbi:nucleotidyltransferase domain-containing protein [Sutcliffiella sp. NPDC057660]|uniref:nucleotidyltransferase domain-containing protein n=1 Tax=Sutcliffiella sp. NPDC057660 TaxID=3346199 RepID=UPI0036AE9582